jgi:hypothetical protein
MNLFFVKLTSINIIDGLPISEIAVDNLRLLPPEYWCTGRSAQSVRPSRFNKHSVIYIKDYLLLRIHDIIQIYQRRREEVQAGWGYLDIRETSRFGSRYQREKISGPGIGTTLPIPREYPSPHSVRAATDTIIYKYMCNLKWICLDKKGFFKLWF